MNEKHLEPLRFSFDTNELFAIPNTKNVSCKRKAFATIASYRLTQTQEKVGRKRNLVAMPNYSSDAQQLCLYRYYG